jgi:hypothetical protein
MTKPTRRSRPTVERKTDNYVFVWAPRVSAFMDLDTHTFIKVQTVIDWMNERYVTFRDLNENFKKNLVGKCMKHLGHMRYSRNDQGVVYKRKQVDTSVLSERNWT